MHHQDHDQYAPLPPDHSGLSLNADGVTQIHLVIQAPEDTPLLNSNNRLHRHAHAKIAARWRAAGAEAVHPSLGTITRKVRAIAHIQKPRAGRYDPNNFWPTVKPLLDGMVDAGLLTDDDHEHLIGPDMRRGPKGPTAIHITFTAATEDNQ